MEQTTSCRLAGAMAQRLREERDELSRRWLDRISARVAIDPNRIFPTDELLDHVPLLIDGIADYLENSADEISADMPVIGKALELGELRFTQGFSAYEILKEYEILGGVLYTSLIRAVDGIDEPCTRGELLACGYRIFRAIAVIQEATASHYLLRADERVAEREERLRGFNRAVSHELKNAIGAVLGAAQILREDWVATDPGQRERFLSIVVENTETMQGVLDNLLTFSRTDGEVRQQQHVLLSRAAAEVARKLREMADSQNVELTVASDLPEVEVNAAAVELCLTNYVSNAIKYSDPNKSRRWVQIRGAMCERDATGDDAERELVVQVVDNGLGVPEPARDKIFQQFFRAHDNTVVGVEGTGLGLSIVRETVASLGGRVWAEFGEEGSVFCFSLPCRRRADTRDSSGLCGEEGQPVDEEPPIAVRE